MLHRAVFEACDDVVRSITGLDKPFGGKMVITVGDWAQTAPVTEGEAGPDPTFNASIRSSVLWPSFRRSFLTVPIRNAGDPDFASFVDAIGLDAKSKPVDLTPFLRPLTSLEDVEAFLFPPNVLADPTLCVQRSFLSPVNVNVDEFNAIILSRLPGEERECSALRIVTIYFADFSSSGVQVSWKERIGSQTTRTSGAHKLRPTSSPPSVSEARHRRI